MNQSHRTWLIRDEVFGEENLTHDGHNTVDLVSLRWQWRACGYVDIESCKSFVLLRFVRRMNL